MAHTYNAGVATAYGAAVAGGYTGTYQEFCEQQAGYAQSAAAVAAAVETAREYESSSKNSKVSADRSQAQASVYADGNSATYIDADGNVQTVSPTAISWTDADGAAHAGTDSAESYAEMARIEAGIAKTKAGNADESATAAAGSATAAAGSATAAAGSATAAGTNAAAAVSAKNQAQTIADSLPADYTTMDRYQKLLADVVPGTVQEIVYDTAGNVQAVTHKSGGTAIRTDVFTFGSSSITEVRTLSTGESLTIVVDTDAMTTETTYSDD